MAATMPGNHETIESIVDCPYAEWGPDDAYALYRFFTHALSKASKYEYYRTAVSGLKLETASPEARALARTAIHDIPGSLSFFSPESRARLVTNEVLECPVRLNSRASDHCRLASFGVLI